MNGIRLSGIRKVFDTDDGRLEVLKELNLFVPEKKITVLLGRSGCGKTTILRLIAGLEKINAGSIEKSQTAKTAFVFQEPRLMPWLNVYKNVAFGLKRKQISKAEIERQINLVGLSDFKRAYPFQLSGGMQQRVAIARAMAYKADFIMMDEPFAALDYFTREQMQKELIRIHLKNEPSILFVTHSIDEALLIADKIVIIEKGGVKAEFEIKESKKDRNLFCKFFLELRMQIMQQLENKNQQN